MADLSGKGPRLEPSLDEQWENHPAHFWLVLTTAALSAVLAYATSAAAEELGEDILVCGDKKADKARVARLIELIPGLRAVNAGALEMARIVEQLTPLLISINVRHKAHAGIRITGLPDGSDW